MKKEFWRDWKSPTQLEKQAIKSLKVGKRIILQNIPREKIQSIYVKGTFVMREMNSKSDVDLSIIVKESKLMDKINKLNKKFKEKHKPQIGFTGYSIQELKKGKISRYGKQIRTGPRRALKQFHHYKLIYGEPLDLTKFDSGKDVKQLETMIKVFNELFLPSYRKGKFGFAQIVKQVFWLTENELRAKNIKHGYSYRKIAKAVKDKNHIIHEALKIRLKPTKDKAIRKQFIAKLKKHLRELEIK